MGFVFNHAGYRAAIEDNLTIVDKNKQEVPFLLNKAQAHFLENATEHNVILKARKMGFSSVLLAVAVIKFLYGENERCVSMSFDKSASSKQLERAKHFIKSYEQHNKIKVPMKYNSKTELVWEQRRPDGTTFQNSLRVGTAQSNSFGRGDDITFLHLTEVAMTDGLEYLLAGAGEATVNDAMVTLETTAFGYNEFKGFWDEADAGQRDYKTFFYDPYWEYDQAFVDRKRQQLGRLAPQEYPLTPQEAFLATGANFFDRVALQDYLTETREPLNVS
jgi:hypothetical protein